MIDVATLMTMLAHVASPTEHANDVSHIKLIKLVFRSWNQRLHAIVIRFSLPNIHPVIAVADAVDRAQYTRCPHHHRSGLLMDPNILLVGGWREVFDKVLSLGVRVTVFYLPEKKSELPADPRCTGYEMNIRDEAACLELARRIHEVRPFVAVASFTEWGLESAAHIGSVLGIRTNPEAPVRLTRNKLIMRERLAQAGLGNVRFRRCDTIEDARAFFAAGTTPIILKPISGAGSVGVAKVERPEELDAAWAWTSGAGDSVLAEEYLVGPEFSVDTVSFDGNHEVVAITEKVTNGAPHFIELGHQLPARLAAETQAMIAEETIRFLDIIGQRIGPAHTEIKIVDDQVRFIESQTRTGGDQIWEMADLATGCDMIRATVEFLVFGRRSMTRSRDAAAAIRFMARERFTLDRIEGVGDAEAIPGIVRVKLKVKPGTTIGALDGSESRIGYVLSVAESVDEAVSRSEAAMACVRLIPVAS